jgi:hypothetical protein
VRKNQRKRIKAQNTESAEDTEKNWADCGPPYSMEH